ncbi:hypothetical protein [Burkholderia sp. MSMB1826]|uniref:hypothetical protein n=1 Tax=Burkholderia sp. MSMB1826 TaxID=1637875 RepID=UPI000A6C384E|nr:hypothetical protein [Burkholderia sp. MSMB1826]
MGDPKQAMCIEQNGRSITGWLLGDERVRRGPEAIARRGGRDLHEGWLDCGNEVALFHGYIKKLSDRLVFPLNGNFYRLAQRPVLVRTPTIISRLISSARAAGSSKNAPARIPHR